MRCRLCGERAGLRFRCADCRTLWATWQANRGRGMRRLLDAFVTTEVSREHIERFLDAEPARGQGTIRDYIAAEMANQLLAALGQGASQDPRKTKKLREIGAWRNFDQRPEE
jgi:hypothetical protein